MKKIGKLVRLYRHPVKAMRGERLENCRVDTFGLYGDRSHYFLDPSNQGKYLSADKVPALLGYSARFIGEERPDVYPDVHITSPKGKEYRWGDAQLFKELEEVAKRPVTPMRSTPLEGGRNWEDHLLIVTQSSLREIASGLGSEKLDERRFRPNLVIALDEDQPFAEDEWFGRQLRIHDVVLRVNKHCERCTYVNIDPETLEMNPAVLKTVVKRHENHFGVYASVVEPGTLTSGDEVYLL
ncbi:MOSC domain-containing protein [Brevibacillus sp. H7]|uniref:MOSC domain-containing protein n=1 Tax=Brevibacillus sp. H7 TaxID=3349138 RepID=UPI00380EC1C4